MSKLKIYRVSISTRRPVATITASANEFRVQGDLDVVDFAQQVMSSSHGHPISLDDDPVEWIRGLEQSYNRGGQGQVFARFQD